MVRCYFVGLPHFGSLSSCITLLEVASNYVYLFLACWHCCCILGHSCSCVSRVVAEITQVLTTGLKENFISLCQQSFFAFCLDNWSWSMWSSMVAMCGGPFQVAGSYVLTAHHTVILFIPKFILKII